MHIPYLTAPIWVFHKRHLPPSMSHYVKNLFQISPQIQRYHPLYLKVHPYALLHPTLAPGTLATFIVQVNQV